MKQLKEIEQIINELAKIIGAKKDQLPTYGTSIDCACPHIEVHDDWYHYIVVERGEELSKKSTTDFNELIYYVFENTTHTLAFDYELKNRIENQDSRRIAFSKQIELMTVIDKKMGERIKADITEILSLSPYNDNLARNLTNTSTPIYDPSEI
jgi:hypothetical protein